MKIKDVLTHGPLIGSEKIYVPGQLFPELRVGMRRIVLSDWCLDAPAPRAEVLRLRPGQPPARISPQAALTPEA